MMSHRHGIQTFRRRGADRVKDVTLPAAFVLDAHMAIAAEVVASFRPAATLQLHGGTRRTRAVDVAETIEHAVTELGVRSVVLCTQAAHPPELSAQREPFLADALWLYDHLWLARVFRDHDVVIESLWFDVERGELHLWSPSAARFELLTDSGVDAFVERVRTRAHDQGAV